MNLAQVTRNRELRDPSGIRFLLSNTAVAPLWLIVRLYLGWQWLIAGWHKVEDGGVGWTDGSGAALQGFWTRIVQVPDAPARPAVTYDWYRDFIQFMLDRGWYEWFGYVIAYGEVILGIALIVGVFTGLAALGGAFMNFNFMLAGTASTNPVLFLLAVMVLLAWKVSGYIGVDRWLLPALGTPWQAIPGRTERTAPHSGVGAGTTVTGV